MLALLPFVGRPDGVYHGACSEPVATAFVVEDAAVTTNLRDGASCHLGVIEREHDDLRRMLKWDAAADSRTS